MDTVTLLGLPLVALLLRCLVGAGLATLLAARLPRDVQAALVPVVGSAVFVCSSQLLKLGAPVRALTAAVIGLGAALTVARLPHVLRAVRQGAAPLAVAVAAMALAGAPGLARGDWSAATWGNADPYLWVSQARAYLDGASAAGSPDALAFERVDELRWRVAVPFGVARLAAVSGLDPSEVYGAFVVVVAVLVPLAGYAAARSALGFGIGPALLAGLALAANAQLLLGSLGGWQAQLMLTAFALGSAAALSVGLGPGAGRRPLVLSGLLGAATLATYGPAAAAFLALAGGGVLLAYLVCARDGLRGGLRAAGLAASVAAALALPALVDTTRSVGRFAGQLDEDGWRGLARPLPSEPLGLLARDGWMQPQGSALWTLGGLALAVGLLALAAVALRRAPRHELVLGPGLLVLAGAVALDALGHSPYLSFKLLAYGAPFLVLLVAAGLLRAGRHPLALAAAAGCAVLLAGSTATVLRDGLDRQVTARDLAGLRLAAGALPADARIVVSVTEPWRQSWALYFLRDRAVSVPSPSIYLTGIGWGRDPGAFDRGGEYRLAPEASVGAVWRGAGLSLARVG